MQRAFDICGMGAGICRGSRKYAASMDLNTVDGSCTVPCTITNLLDTEESYWSPMYGIKGNVDVSVEALVGSHSKGAPPIRCIFPGVQDGTCEHVASCGCYIHSLHARKVRG